MQSKRARKKLKNRIVLLGVTGGIGSGKTAVCSFLKQMGCSVYHADDIAKQLYIDNVPLRRKLVKLFGTRIHDNKKDISVEKLRKLVFSNKYNQQRVGRIVHPFVISELMKRIKSDESNFIVIEAALIFETNFDKYLDYTILIRSNVKTRIKRISERNHITGNNVKKIIKLQMPEKEKTEKADFVIPNNGNINELKKNVKLVFQTIKRNVKYE